MWPFMLAAIAAANVAFTIFSCGNGQFALAALSGFFATFCALASIIVTLALCQGEAQDET